MKKNMFNYQADSLNADIKFKKQLKKTSSMDEREYKNFVRNMSGELKSQQSIDSLKSRPD